VIDELVTRVLSCCGLYSGMLMRPEEYEAEAKCYEAEAECYETEAEARVD